MASELLELEDNVRSESEKENQAIREPKPKQRPDTDRLEEADPRDRWEWFHQSRRDAKGNLLRNVYLHASRRRHALAKEMGTEPGGTPGPAGSVNWTPIGPSVISAGIPVSGRITAIAAGPAGNRIYAGSANGGVWFSSDGGATWAPLDDYIVSPSLFGGAAEADSLSVGALAVRFGASAIADEVYVGTGEANGNYDAYLGIGIRHLVSGAWTLEATNLAGRGIYAIVIDPNNPAAVFAATTGGLFRRPTSGSMTTWTQVTSAAFTNSNGQVSALIIAGSGTSKRYFAAFSGDRVYSSPDGATWTALTGLSGTGRIALAAGESDPTVVYALRADGTLNRLLGTAFSVVTGLPGSVLFADPPSGQGWYDIAVAADPTNPNTVTLGGDAYALFKGTITGSAGSWVFPFNPANTASPWLDPTWVGSGVHSDVHALAYALNAAGTAHDPTILWAGSDGGLFASTASGAAGTFQARNLGLAITEFAYLAQRSDTDAVVFAGAQDNGTPRLLGEQAAVDNAGGDGGGVTYDPTNPYRAMRQYVRASLYLTTDGGASWPGVSFPPITAATTAQQNAANTENGNTGFVAPLASVGSGTASLVAFGTNRLWLSSNWGGSWVTLPTGTNPYAAATPDLNQDVIGGGGVQAIAFASATRVYAATFNTIWRYDLTGTTWSRTDITAGLPAFRFITAIAVENAATGSVYVTMGGGGLAHVYYFNGTTWSVAMPTTVVDVPTHAIAVDPANPNNVYVGTDVGCFRGIKAGASWSWSLFSQGLPEAAVTDLQIHSAARLLRAATHGRSVWEIALDATTGLDPDVYLRANYNDAGRLIGTSRASWVEGRPDPTHFDATNPYILYHYMSADIKVRRSSLSGLPALGTPVSYLDFATNIGDYVDTVGHIETADVSGTDRIFVLVHNRSLNAVPAAQVRVLLLVADASAGLPALPSGYAAQINAGSTSAWLAGSQWRFVDPASPYRVLSRDLDVRTPQVVEYQLDFSVLSLPSGHTHVCLAAFVNTPGDPITSTNINLDQVTMTDKHIAHRNTHLVPLGTRPGSEGGKQGAPSSQTFLIDFHNPTKEAVAAELVFDRRHFAGELSVVLPKLDEIDHGPNPLDGFRVVEHSLKEDLEHAVGRWLHHVGELLEDAGDSLQGEVTEADCQDAKRWRLWKLSKLDRRKSLVAVPGHGVSTANVRIRPGGFITAAVTVQAPPGANHGEHFRLDILQRQQNRIVGGSTYIVAIAEPR